MGGRIKKVRPWMVIHFDDAVVNNRIWYLDWQPPCHSENPFDVVLLKVVVVLCSR